MSLARWTERIAARKAPLCAIRLGALLLLTGVAVFPAAGARAEQASQPSSPAAGQIDAGGDHTCALVDAKVRCWGLGFSGQLGYGNKDSIGDDEAPGSVGSVSLGPGRTATAISAGDFHTCALLDDGTVRCWGFGGNGRLGYGNENDIGDDETLSWWGFCVDGRLGNGDPNTIGDDETPASAGPVSLGGRATAITAGGAHTCAVLENGSVRCWGTNGQFFGGDGRLGYGNGAVIGNDETPDSVDPVDIGTGRTATAISAGDNHTCAVLNGGDVRCWGLVLDGRLGYVTRQRAVGDNEAPAAFGPVALGRPVTAISAGRHHTCARLDDGNVRCWGRGADGRLGYANTNSVGDDETPDTAGPVNLGADRKANAISAGGSHTCGQLDAATLRCWGEGLHGRLGYGDQDTVGDDEAPGAAGPVDFRPRASISDRTLAEGDAAEAAVTFTVELTPASDKPASVGFATADGSARAPEDYAAGSGSLLFAPGELSKTVTIDVKGDTLDEPDEDFFVNLTGSSTVAVAAAQGKGTIIDDDVATPDGPTPDGPSPPDYEIDSDAAALRAQASRRRGLKRCLAQAKRHTTGELRRARRLTAPRRAGAKRHARRHASKRRRACLSRWGRTPGRVLGLEARAVSPTTIVLEFRAPGSDGRRPPAAHTYLVKQSFRPLRGARDFRRADALCDGSCRFSPGTIRVGGTVTLRVTDLRPRTAYYYSVAARDNVSRRAGPRSAEVRARTP